MLLANLLLLFLLTPLQLLPAMLLPLQRYQVGLTQRQFNRVDPDNRLVAAELEQRYRDCLT